MDQCKYLIIALSCNPAHTVKDLTIEWLPKSIILRRFLTTLKVLMFIQLGHWYETKIACNYRVQEIFTMLLDSGLLDSHCSIKLVNKFGN